MLELVVHGDVEKPPTVHLSLRPFFVSDHICEFAHYVAFHDILSTHFYRLVEFFSENAEMS